MDTTLPTPERIAHASELYEGPRIDQEHVRPYARVACPLARLHGSGRLHDYQMAAWERWCEDVDRANRIPGLVVQYKDAGNEQHYLLREDADCPQERTEMSFQRARDALRLVNYRPTANILMALALEPGVTMQDVGERFSGYKGKPAIAAAVTLTQQGTHLIAVSYGFAPEHARPRTPG